MTTSKEGIIKLLKEAGLPPSPDILVNSSLTFYNSEGTIPAFGGRIRGWGVFDYESQPTIMLLVMTICGGVLILFDFKKKIWHTTLQLRGWPELQGKRIDIKATGTLEIHYKESSVK